MNFQLFIPELALTFFLFFYVFSCGNFQISLFMVLLAVLFLYLYRLQSSNGDNSQLSGKPYIIAHRGAGYDAPENTIAAMKLAKENGATAVEFDVDYTADGVAVVFHDDTVDRCTNGTGKLNSLTLEQVKQLNASAHHHNKDQFPNEQIPTLDEMVEFCLANDLMMFIDVKSNVKLSTEKLVDLFRRHPELYKKAAVCSFNPLIVYSVRMHDSNIVGGLTHRSHYLARKVDKTESEGPWYKKLLYPLADVVLQWSHYYWLWFLCGSTYFLQNLGDVSESTVEHFAKRGVQVVVWTVNRPQDRSYCLKSLRCPIITDTMSEEGFDVQKN